MTIKEKLAHYTWDIAYGAYSNKILVDGLKGVNLHIVKNPYKCKWFADPFILDEDENNIQFLVEEYDYSVGKGRIARILVNKKNDLIEDLSIILELPTHLSFPAIYRIDGNIYVHPENSASGSSYLYRYDCETDKLINPQLVVSEPIVDAVILRDGDLYRMYATRVPEANGCKLHVYTSHNFCGPYMHLKEEYYRENTARMAGMFLTNEKPIIRPAQDCLRGYGKAVVFYDGVNPVCIIKPSNYKYAGIHTFNTYKSTFVIDLKKYDYPLTYKLTRLLKT